MSMRSIPSLSPSPRPPVVVVLGHIDHGKTTLLDRLRASRVAEHEVGQITQALTGSAVATWHGCVTFLDTPGHEAFDTMRARGASSTDLVLLVVSAVDGAQEMTRLSASLALRHALPLVVAITKVDAAGANPGKTRQQLLALGLVPEELGGEVLVREVSARTGQGMDELLEALALQAMMRDPRAASAGAGEGYVLDAMLDPRLGPRARVLVRSGVIRVGDRCQVGNVVGWVRALFDDQQRPLVEALPSMPVEVVGLGAMPRAGAVLRVIERLQAHVDEREEHDPARPRSPAEWLLWRESSQQTRLKVVLRASSQGTLEALLQALSEPREGVVVDVIRASVGRVTEGDIKLATTASALVLGFGVKVLRQAAEMARDERVTIVEEETIYRLLERVNQAARALHPSTPEAGSPVDASWETGDPQRYSASRARGKGEVLQVFRATADACILGVRLHSGEAWQEGKVRVWRDGRTVGIAVAATMQRRKKTIDHFSISRGETDFGLGLTRAPEVHPGDRLFFFDR